ncbi:MAG: rhodanese-like domain-containing protein [Gemmataceae bacterium]
MPRLLRLVRSAVYAFLIWAIERILGVRHTRDPLATVKQSVAENKAVLVDVREVREWGNGHVSGAVFLPLSRIRAGISADELMRLLPRDQPIYLHCGAGGRCLLAASSLRKHGYDLRPLKPGFDELVQFGFPRAVEGGQP